MAALSVVAFHAAERTGHHFAIGAAGVDVFFIISGFIMWVVGDLKPVDPVRFMRDRIRRIVPIYWLATATMVFGGLAGLFANLVLDPGHILASLFFIPMESPGTDRIWPILVQGWTLNYEMFFYVIFAGSLLLPRNRRLGGVILLLACLVLIGGLPFENAILATYTNPILLEFAIGMLIGEIWLRDRIPTLAAGIVLTVLSVSGFALIWLLGLPFGTATTAPLAAALVVGFLSLEKAGYMPHLRVANLIGDASYSIYLWHTFVLAVVVKAAGAIALPAGITLVLSAALAVMGGIAAYGLIERPLLRLGRRPALSRAPAE